MKNIYILLGWLMPDTTPTGLTDDQFQAQLVREQTKATLWATTMDDYLSFIGDGYWDVKVTGQMIQTEYPGKAAPSNFNGDWGMSAMSGYLRENDIGYTPNYFAAHGGYYKGISGFGQVNGNKITLYKTAGFKTWPHEFRHNLGFGEGNTIRPDGTVEFYGDETGIGGSNRLQAFTAPARAVAGLETEREIIRISETTEFNLAPLELHPDGLNDNEYCVAIVQDGAATFYISIRKTDPLYPLAIKSTWAGSVHIHQMMSGDRHTYRLLPDLRVGESKEIFAGCTVKHMEYEHDRSRVEARIEDE